MLRPSRTTTIEPYSNDRRQWQAESSRDARMRNARQKAARKAEAESRLNQAVGRTMESRLPGISDWSMGGVTPNLGSQGVTTPQDQSLAPSPEPQKRQTGVMPLGQIDARVGVTPAGYSKSRKATTVRDVILGEAKAGDIKDMEHIASVIANRARELGISEQDVVASGDFKAYGRSLPAGVSKFAKQAEAALAKVAKDGPVTNATYYSTPDQVGNLGRNVTKTGVVATTKGHQYYAAPLKAGVPLNALAETETPPAVDAVNEMATGGLMAKPDPAARRSMPGAAIASKQGLGAYLGAQAKNGLASFYGEPTVAETPEQIDAATVQQATQQAVQKAQQVAQPSYSVNNTPATPAQRMGEMIDMPGMTDFERSVNAQSAAKFDPDAVKAAGLSRLGPPDVASMPGGIRANAAVNPDPGMVTDDKGSYAHPFGPAQFGIMAKTDTPKFQNSLTNPETATGPTVMSVPAAEKQARLTPSVQEAPAAPEVAAADPNAAYEAAHPVNTAFDDQYEAAAAPDLNAPTDVPDYSVADVPEAAPDEPTIGEYPSAPEPSFAESNPRLTSTVKDAIKGLALGGPMGAAIGGIGGLMAGRLGPGFNDAVPSGDRFSVGSGLPGIMGAQRGPYGATANSLSNPGMSYTSLGGNLGGMRRSNKFGWTEHVAPDGSVIGISYDDPGTKGLLGKINGRVGGLMSGKRSGGLSEAGSKAIGAGKGGLY